MGNRCNPYITEVKSRGDLLVLYLDNNEVLTEITAVCEYLHKITVGSRSSFGNTPKKRAETRMYLRRVDLEIAQPIVQWYRDDSTIIGFYQCNRLPIPEAHACRKV